MGRRLSESERLDRKVRVSRRDVEAAQDELDKLERQLAMIDSGQLRAIDRDHFALKHTRTLTRLRTHQLRLQEAEAELEAYESSLARYQPREELPEPEETLEGEELSATIAEIKRQAELGEPA